MLNEYKFKHKNQLYLIKVSPDIAVHGGSRGKGTTTSIWRLDASGNVIPGVAVYQGRHSKAGILRAIKARFGV